MKLTDVLATMNASTNIEVLNMLGDVLYKGIVNECDVNKNSRIARLIPQSKSKYNYLEIRIM